MSVATALASGFEAAPQVAESAVRQAMEKAGLGQTGGVLLFLSPDFSRHAQGAVLAAARAAGSLQVAGMVVPGLFTESGWSLDRPAAAALVMGNGFALAPAGGGSGAPLLSFSANSALPPEWQAPPPRVGLMHNDSPLWQAGRPVGEGRMETVIHGGRCRVAVSTGLRQLGPYQPVDQARNIDLVRLGGMTAAESLSRALPPEVRERSPLPIHLLCLVRKGSPQPAVPILSANADGSLTLAERLMPGEQAAWAVRQPVSAEADMISTLEAAGAECPDPAFGLMFSCIGRGPLFYGDDDRDLAAFRTRFPGVPLLGAYGSSQIAPAGRANRQWQNSVITALFEADHV